MPYDVQGMHWHLVILTNVSTTVTESVRTTSNFEKIKKVHTQYHDVQNLFFPTDMYTVLVCTFT